MSKISVQPSQKVRPSQACFDLRTTTAKVSTFGCHFPQPRNVQSGLFSTQVRKQVAPMVKFHQNAYCPECGKRVTHGDVEKMREACLRMWRKFMRLLISIQHAS